MRNMHHYKRMITVPYWLAGSGSKTVLRLSIVTQFSKLYSRKRPSNSIRLKVNWHLVIVNLEAKFSYVNLSFFYLFSKIQPMTRSKTLDTNLRYIQIIRNRKQRKDLCSNILFTSERGVTKPHPSGQASDIPRTFRLLDMIFFLKKGYRTK